METLPRPRYLTQDDKGFKLRRTIPLTLRIHAAGRSAIVERLGRVRFSEARERANLFAVRTDQQLRELRLKADRDQDLGVSVWEAEGVSLRLAKNDVERLALLHFAEHDQMAHGRGSYAIDFSDPRYDEWVEEAGLDQKWAIEAHAGHHPGGGSTVVALLEKGDYLTGFPTDQAKRNEAFQKVFENENVKRLVALVEQADIELATRRLEALRSGHVPAIQHEFFQSAVHPGAIEGLQPAKHRSHNLQELTDEFLERKRGTVGVSRYNQLVIPIRALLEEIGGDVDLSSIARADCQNVADLFVQIPPRPAKKYPKLSLREAARAFEQDTGEPTQRFAEAAKSLATIRRVFDLAIDLEWLSSNPVERVRIKKPANFGKHHQATKESYDPFTDADLKAVFSAPLFNGCVDDESNYAKAGSNRPRRHRYWTPIIALYSGMRMNEILQLESSDIRQEGSVWYFAITDEEAETYNPDEFQKRLKNRNAVRDIPIHPKLVELGLLSWVEQQGAGRLFPEARSGGTGKPSGSYSKHFLRFLKQRGVWAERRKVFHSFRHTFNDALRAGGVPNEIRDAINGWEAQRTMDRRYGRGHKIETLASHLATVDYGDLLQDQ